MGGADRLPECSFICGADRLLEYRRSVRILSAGMEDFGRQASSKDFTFSVCLDETADQQDFFDSCGVKSLISKTLDGYAAPGHSHRLQFLLQALPIYLILLPEVLEVKDS